LVLTGGQSRRMGHDKAHIKYHNKPHYQHTADIISPQVEETFISVAHDHNSKEKFQYKLIKDQHSNMGPIGGILSAFKYNPDVAWLTVACDLPFITTDVIAHLINQRQPSKIATCYLNPKRQSPEPLLTIWEPTAYPIIQDYLSKGIDSPMRILLDQDINLINIKNPKALMNANDPVQKRNALDDLDGD
ncbi:NTP transferase domain-containing protein, partial [Saprospiraceae bacterium]|nr:NTP transferase domain-containing protein [Saprospiraceae bacterium]